MGYWKGSGFAIMLDVLAAVLSEGAPTNAIDKNPTGQLHRLFPDIHPDRPGKARWRNIHRADREQRGRLCAQLDSGGGKHGDSLSRRKCARHSTEADESGNPCRRRRLERSADPGCEEEVTRLDISRQGFSRQTGRVLLKHERMKGHNGAVYVL
jgi:hypothetical protein